MKRLILTMLCLAATGCVTAPIEFCPGYKPAHQLTDRLLESFNTSVKQWPAGTTPETDRLKAAGWDRSAWSDRRTITCSSEQAHMRAFLTHYRADGSKISREDFHYRFERRDGEWVIAARSPGAL